MKPVGGWGRTSTGRRGASELERWPRYPCGLAERRREEGSVAAHIAAPPTGEADKKVQEVDAADSPQLES